MDMKGREAQEAYNLLKVLGKQKAPIVTIFKSLWQQSFSCIEVPSLQVFGEDKDAIVRIDRLQAMEYLKNRFNFYTHEEREEALYELAEELQKET